MDFSRNCTTARCLAGAAVAICPASALMEQIEGIAVRESFWLIVTIEE